MPKRKHVGSESTSQTRKKAKKPVVPLQVVSPPVPSHKEMKEHLEAWEQFFRLTRYELRLAQLEREEESVVDEMKAIGPETIEQRRKRMADPKQWVRKGTLPYPDHTNCQQSKLDADIKLPNATCYYVKHPEEIACYQECRLKGTDVTFCDECVEEFTGTKFE